MDLQKTKKQKPTSFQRPKLLKNIKISWFLYWFRLFCSQKYKNLKIVEFGWTLNDRFLEKMELCKNSGIQSHYIEVVQWTIFMEHNMRFGLTLGRVAILKKSFGPILSNFWEQFFHVFRGKKFLRIYCIVHTKRLHKIKLKLKKKKWKKRGRRNPTS